MRDRLVEDHTRARELARLIGAAEPPTNIVYSDLPPDAVGMLRARGVLAFELDGHVRFVTHRLIGDEDIRRAGEVVASVTRHASEAATATRPATENAVPPTSTSRPAN